MTASESKSLPSIGFLTIRHYDAMGLIGGYLLLNTSGRPLEFHCTAPVRPNRAQEILYGPTLQPFLCGEQIGQTLFSKGKHRPLFICTDVQPAVSLADFVAPPVVFLTTPTVDSTEGSGRRLHVDESRGVPAQDRLTHFELGGHAAAVSARRPDDPQRVLQSWQPFDQELDLTEPFTRLADAIDETQGGSSRPKTKGAA